VQIGKVCSRSKIFDGSSSGRNQKAVLLSEQVKREDEPTILTPRMDEISQMPEHQTDGEKRATKLTDYQTFKNTYALVLTAFFHRKHIHLYQKHA